MKNLFIKQFRSQCNLARISNQYKYTGLNTRFYHFKQCSVFGHRPFAPVLKPNPPEPASESDQVQLVHDFRTAGHLLANINPLYEYNKWTNKADLEPVTKLLTHIDKSTSNVDPKLSDCNRTELINYLRKIYCGETGLEFMHINSASEREWIAHQWEQLSNQFELNQIEQQRIVHTLIKCETLDHYLALKFPSVKRYGAEGAESMLIFLDELFRQSAFTNLVGNCPTKPFQDCGIKLQKIITDIVIGMPHRGRLNFLSILMQMPEVIMFQKMKGKPEFNLDEIDGITGDVLSHLYNSVDLMYNYQGEIINDQTSIDQNVLSHIDSMQTHNSIVAGKVHVSLLPNPSHLEAVCPVVSGKVRAKLLSQNQSVYSREAKFSHPVLGVQIHGDSAFSGQGIIFEQMQFAQFPHFNSFGTIHLVVNNQIGYTIEGSVRDGPLFYATNVMKSADCPILHVNGARPEELIKATRFALKYRETFHKDILIDLICYRKYGHNELDDPTFTNPLLYKNVKSRPKSIPMEYATETADWNFEEIEKAKNIYKLHLNQQLDLVETYQPINNCLKGAWNKMKFPKKNQIEHWDTGVSGDTLRYLAIKSINTPVGFDLHKNLKRIFHNRLERIKNGKNFDWSLAESLAFASLMYQGFNVRLSGQDVGRGTFSQRHMMLIDQSTGVPYIPLNVLTSLEDDKPFLDKMIKQSNLEKSEDCDFSLIKNDSIETKLDLGIGQLEIANSILSEEAVLAFEYGFSIESPNNLVIWEAQFGDFFNGAQIIFDTFISSGETKWCLQSGLVCLLPHGYDGAGPEHSSCRLERFLQSTNSSEHKLDDELVNMQIVFPTTPAQYFHLLRRQMIRNFRKPLIVASPKTLLRYPKCVSDLQEFTSGTYFRKVLDDNRITNGPQAQTIKKLVFCSGKHYYTLLEHVLEQNINDVALVRVEQLAPFPAMEINQIIKKYSNAKSIIWSQEEHRNMGAWNFIQPRFANILNCKIKYVGKKNLQFQQLV